jgi:hypothetical protein
MPRLSGGPEGGHPLPDAVGSLENGKNPNTYREPIAADRSQPCRRKAAALGAVGGSAKLTRRDDPLQIGGNRLGGAREETILRSTRRPAKDFNHTIGQLEFGKVVSQMKEFIQNAQPHVTGQYLAAGFPLLGRKDAEPDAPNGGTGTPKIKELAEVSRTLRHLAGNGAVYGDFVSLDMLEDAVVCRRFSPFVMFRLQAVDRDTEIEIPYTSPLGRNRADRARNDLCGDPALLECREQGRYFPESHQRFAAHERNVQRLVLVNQPKNPVYEFVPFEVGHLVEPQSTPEMIGLVGVAAWTGEWTFAGDFDRERWCSAVENTRT